MPYITYNGQLYEITQTQYDSYTVGATPPAGAVNLTAGLANDLNLVVPAGGTVLNNSTATTPILIENTTNNTPGQTLNQTTAVAQSTAIVDAGTQQLIDAGLYDPGVGFNPNGTPVAQGTGIPVASTLSAGETIVPVPVEQIDVDPATNPTAGGAFVETSPGVFQAAEDLPVDPATDPTAGGAFVEQADGSFLAAEDLPITDINGEAASPTEDPNVPQEVSATTTDRNTGAGTSSDSAAADANIQGLVNGAQAQQTIADQRKQINNGDWRVRLRLAPQSNYLYNAPTPGILQPLKVTDGIIFPYTPQIDTSYRATYEQYDLTHSNYRGYFYKNSYVDAINLKTVFTAQDTNDANYLLAVITFLKSVTKMFYGQDAQRGAPPPLVYLSGFGDYQFREHPCVVSQFTYNLPDSVDYIRAGSPNNSGLNFNNIRDRQSVATNSIFGSINRLAAAFLTKGAITGSAPPPTLGLNRPTYVPTKMDINLTLLPIQSRQQVSKQFSVKEFANGNLIKGGFW